MVLLLATHTEVLPPETRQRESERTPKAVRSNGRLKRILLIPLDGQPPISQTGNNTRAQIVKRVKEPRLSPAGRREWLGKGVPDRQGEQKANQPKQPPSPQPQTSKDEVGWQPENYRENNGRWEAKYPIKRQSTPSARASQQANTTGPSGGDGDASTGCEAQQADGTKHGCALTVELRRRRAAKPRGNPQAQLAGGRLERDVRHGIKAW